MKEHPNIERICPKCGLHFVDHPALSRTDNETLICPDCGTREALESLGICKEEQNEILLTIHNFGLNRDS